MERIMENEKIRVTVSDDGAELVSVWDKEKQTERIWCGDPAVWGRHAPILFPFVGSLCGGKYRIDGKEYAMTSHGFARDRRFELVQADAHTAVHVLHADEASKEIYPYDFTLYVKHSIEGSTVQAEWRVVNEGMETMRYSIGGHPAFNFPRGQKATDCSLRIPAAKEDLTYYLLKDGNIDLTQTYTLKLQNGDAPITGDMFDRDALIVMGSQIGEIELLDADGAPYVRMDCNNFPYFGIWSKPVEAFLCLEPWYGVADIAGFDGDLDDKRGIQSLAAGESRSYTHTISFL